jgi:hypothetical protein
MSRCFACETLVGMPSSVAPHASLQLIEAPIVGVPGNPFTHYLQYLCSVCGSWFHQNDLEGSPPGLWSACESEASVENQATQLAPRRER